MSKIIKLNNSWIRDKRQENVIQVFRWYEKPKDGIIASIVEGYFPTELNLRISQNCSNCVEIRGSKSIIIKKSDLDNINTIEMMLKRECVIEKAKN